MVIYAIVFSVGGLYILRLIAKGPEAGAEGPVAGVGASPIAAGVGEAGK